MHQHELIGGQLRSARKDRKLTQQELADQLKTSQKTVSLWETGQEVLSDAARKWLDANPPSEGNNVDVGATAQVWSYPKATFQRLWSESPKRLRHFSLIATVTPNREDKGFVDVELAIHFEGLRVPTNETPLYLDCIGVAPKKLKKQGFRHCLDERECSHLRWLGKAKDTGRRTQVEEYAEVQEVIGPHAIGYRLWDADEDDVTVVRILGERGARIDGIESAGLPVYPDCPVERLSIKVKFDKKLKPKSPPKAEVWPLRRTLVASRPVSLASGLEMGVTEAGTDYAFSNLRYPKAGFGYCIAWDGLQQL